MPMDPISFWIQASVFWARVFKEQHEAYLRLLGAVAVTVPHPSAADLSQQAQASAEVIASATAPEAKTDAKKPEIQAKSKPVVAVPEPVTV
jgi:hypothetical protein